MRRSKCVTTTKKTRRSRKYDDFITIVLLHDQIINRMRCHEPICFIELNDQQKLIDKQIQAINSRFKNYELIISIGNYADKIYDHIKKKHKNKSIRLIENMNYMDTNSCESIRLCIHNTNNDKILVIDGNLCFNDKVFDNLDFNKSFALVNKNNEESLEIGVNVHNEKIQFLCYGASQKWSEIFFLKGSKIILDLESTLNKKSFKKKFWFEAINELVANHNIAGFINKSEILKIKNIKTYNIARRQNEILD